MSHLQLFLKVGDYPESPDDDFGLPQFSIVHRQTIKAVYFYIGQMLRRLANLIQSLRNGKQCGFTGISQHRHDDARVESRPSLHHVEMSQGNRIEAAGIDCDHNLWVSELLTRL